MSYQLDLCFKKISQEDYEYGQAMQESLNKAYAVIEANRVQLTDDHYFKGFDWEDL